MTCIAQALKALLPALLCFALPAALAAQDAPRDRDLNRIPPSPAQASAAGAVRMMALVIGNSDYNSKWLGKLPNAKNDAQGIAAALEQPGVEVELPLDLDHQKMRAAIEVELHLDLNHQEMEAAIRAFSDRLTTSGSVGFFYYAGHGIQHDSKNYLIPIGANIRYDHDIKYQAIAVEWVRESMSRADNPLNVLVLDACRNNPFLPFNVKQGFAKEANSIQGNMIIAYSTAAGATASEGGPGGNSPYSHHLKASIEQTSGITLQDMLELVQTNVAHATDNQQDPFLISASSSYNFYLVLPGEGVPIKKSYEVRKIERVIPGHYLLAALVAVAIILLVYAKAQSPSLIALTPDNLGAQYNPDALAYLCNRETGAPLSAVTENSRLIIGRVNDKSVHSDITLQDELISAKHAELSCEAGKFYITDLGSRNGTYVQRQRLAAHQRTLLPPTGDFHLARRDLAFILRPGEP